MSKYADQAQTMMPRILACARAAGGGAAIAPVLWELQRDADTLILANEYAESVFRDRGLTPVCLPEYTEEALRQLIAERWAGQLPDVVITSTASLPELDMTERYLWRWARTNGIPSIGVLDQWQHYEERFSGNDPGEHLSYLPDWITAIDQHAQRGLIDAGVPARSIVVTGQPAFDRLAGIRADFGPDDREALRKMVRVPRGTQLVCFVAEAFAGQLGERLGYDEHSVLRELIAVCGKLVIASNIPLHIAVKLHPANDPETFAWLKTTRAPTGVTVTVHESDYPSLPLVMASDVVVGMTSELLMESLLLGCPTVSFQPGAKQTDGLIATVVGAIPLVADQDQCLEVLGGLLGDRRYRANYLKRQARFRATGGATARVVNVVRRAMSASAMAS